jgi:hypothetical protein
VKAASVSKFADIAIVCKVCTHAHADPAMTCIRLYTVYMQSCCFGINLFDVVAAVYVMPNSKLDEKKPSRRLGRENFLHYRCICR